jgi:hypothetical protein
MAKGKYEYWRTTDGLILLQGWARDGLTDEQIAHNMGIRRTTLYDWKNKYPDINDALKKGKEIVDYEVENALLKRAKQGDVTAQIFWLKNRRPEKWRDKVQFTDETSLKKLDSLIEAIDKKAAKS